jgi:hypothetical protein
LPHVEAASTARLGWHRFAFEFREDADLARLENEIEVRIGQRAQEDLLELTLNGALGIEATARLARKLEAWETRLLRLTLANKVRVTPTPDEIEALTQRVSDPLISRVAAKLLERSRQNDEGERAVLALRELHAVCSGA